MDKGERSVLSGAFCPVRAVVLDRVGQLGWKCCALGSSAAWALHILDDQKMISVVGSSNDDNGNHFLGLLFNRVIIGIPRSLKFLLGTADLKMVPLMEIFWL